MKINKDKLLAESADVIGLSFETHLMNEEYVNVRSDGEIIACVHLVTGIVNFYDQLTMSEVKDLGDTLYNCKNMDYEF
ncbi:hypothetical protein [Elizabethkingia phage TCUEAP1]|nr:hypothetical protein [Elizabethkingia phage TCUEAP1]